MGQARLDLEQLVSSRTRTQAGCWVAGQTRVQLLTHCVGRANALSLWAFGLERMMFALKRTALGGVVLTLAALGPAQAQAPQGSAKQALAHPAWPSTVEAHYKLKFNGVGVGKIHFTSKMAGQAYTLDSRGEVSVLFGAIKWTGKSNVAGVVEGVEPAPKSYAFDWAKNKKGGAITLGFAGRKVVNQSVEPPPSDNPELIKITDAHKVGVIDPLSAIMALTMGGKADPCDRRVRVFDGKQRFDIVFSAKRKAHIPASKSGVPSSVGYVCRAMYEPIAGHKNNEASKSYAANRDAEVTLRKLPNSEVLIPHSVTVPTGWGTGSMVIDRIDVTAGTQRYALTE